MRLFFVFLFLSASCSYQPRNKEQTTQQDTTEQVDITERAVAPELPAHDSSFVNLSDLSDDFVFDLRYATSNNFLGEPVYDCPGCYLRYGVARSLVQANKIFLEKGYRIKLFDCYRPLHVQQKMWEKFPNARYVANPYTSSSYHNRGCAVDVTLVDAEGNELDMGTSFDFFGKESHYAYPGVSEEVRRNRDFLREVLESVGFHGIRTEWWHFSKSKYPVSDRSLCDIRGFDSLDER